MDSTSDARPSPSEAPREPAPEHAGSVRVISKSPSGARESDDVAELAALAAEPGANIWIDLTAPQRDVVHRVARDLALHPLIADDIADRNERAKIATYDDMVHVVLFDLEYRGEVQPAEVDLVLGKRFLLSVHGTDSDLHERLLARNGVEMGLGKGPDFLLYQIADQIVDGYFPVLDRLADEIDELQDTVIEAATEWTLQRLFVLKRELIAIRRATS